MKTITLILSTCILFACSSSKSMMATAQAPLYGTKWSLKKIYQDSGTTDVSTKAFIRFDSEKKSGGGNGSCNNFGSSITVEGQQIGFRNIFSTKMYCEDVQQIENAFLSQLDKVTRYEIGDSTLKLFGGDKVLLEFSAVNS
jgi:heat shock protein HslJ